MSGTYIELYISVTRKFSRNRCPCWVNVAAIQTLIKISFIQNSKTVQSHSYILVVGTYQFPISAELQKYVFRDILLFFQATAGSTLSKQVTQIALRFLSYSFIIIFRHSRRYTDHRASSIGSYSAAYGPKACRVRGWR
jgi:hypothetical protein